MCQLHLRHEIIKQQSYHIILIVQKLLFKPFLLAALFLQLIRHLGLGKHEVVDMETLVGVCELAALDFSLEAFVEG